MYNTNENHAKALHYIEELRKGIMRVNFTKVDGTGREMFCTRNHDYISKYVEGSYEGDSEDMIKKDLNSGKITVFDCEKKEFRSFKTDRVNVFVPYSYNIEMKLPNELMKDVYKVYHKKQQEVLENFVVRVLFRKADGSSRYLYGTRNKEFIKKLTGLDIDFDDSEELRKENYVMSLFDLEKCEVRRYKLSRLKEFYLIDRDVVEINFNGHLNTKYITTDIDYVNGLNGKVVHVSTYNYLSRVDVLLERYLNNEDPITILGLLDRDIREDLEEVFMYSVNSKLEEEYEEENEENIVKVTRDKSNSNSGLTNNNNNNIKNPDEVKGKVDKGEVELSIKLEGNLEGAEIKSFRIDGNEVKLVLNIKY